MEQPKQPHFNVIGQYIKDLSFENLAAKKVLDPKKEPIVEVNADVDYSKFDSMPNVPENTYEVVLSLTATMKVGDNPLFIAEAKYAGIVQFDQEPTEEQLEPIAYIEIPYYLFFETRNLVASLANQSGFGPIVLRPVDFSEIYLKKSKHADKLKEKIQ
ncbi:MAG: protein-export chaperone SecB [Alphaproteobacteria bacterium]|nr:MAG: protein-export chaperone SecB [Alphaproteobacteria bacterium]